MQSSTGPADFEQLCEELEARRKEYREPRIGAYLAFALAALAVAVAALIY